MIISDYYRLKEQNIKYPLKLLKIISKENVALYYLENAKKLRPRIIYKEL